MILPGWTCTCGTFNGEAKEFQPKCRACSGDRPDLLTWEEARHVAMNLLDRKTRSYVADAMALDCDDLTVALASLMAAYGKREEAQELQRVSAQPPTEERMKLVIIESPLKALTPEAALVHKEYAKACMRDSLDRGEAPFASHLLYTQVLDDDILDQRMRGIGAGLAVAERADLSAVYVDLGVSKGMRLGIEHAKAHGRRVEERSLRGWETMPRTAV
jgi:hypothetical protein